MKRKWQILIFAFCILNLFGCASLKEGTRGILGISTKILEDERPDAIKKTYNYDYNTCFKKVADFLKEKGSYIYTQDPGRELLALYVSEEDTTPVGVFFKEIDAQNTQVEISSPSTYAKELIAQRIAAALEIKAE